MSDNFAELADRAFDAANGNGHAPADRFTLGDANETDMASPAVLDIFRYTYPIIATDKQDDFLYCINSITSKLRSLRIDDADQIHGLIVKHYLPRVRPGPGIDLTGLLEIIRAKLAEPKDSRCHRHKGGYTPDICPECKKEKEEADREAAIAASRYTCKLIDSATFKTGDFRPKWLVRRMFVQGMPGILGGPRKALKTTIFVDLGISLGTGTPFLGEFAVYQKMRVAILSGESGQHTLQETALRVCAARGIDLGDADVLWGFELPQLSSPLDLAELRGAIEKNKIEVLLFDPLYLALLSGAQADSASASNLFSMGPLLAAIAKACLSVGCTPILAHHARKKMSGESSFEPMELEDLSFAGIQEFARQWLLLNRRKKFEPGTGIHNMWISAGGSIGSGGLWALDVDEGVLDDHFQGRKWEVTVTAASESRELDKQAAAERKSYAQIEKEKGEDAKLLLALDKFDQDRAGIGYTKLRDFAGIRSDAMGRTVARLTLEGIIEDVPGFAVETPNGGKKACRGIRRKNVGNVGT